MDGDPIDQLEGKLWETANLGAPEEEITRLEGELRGLLSIEEAWIDPCQRGRHDWVLAEFQLREVPLGAAGSLDIGGVGKVKCPRCGQEREGS
jgi:hypothetical protein